MFNFDMHENEKLIRLYRQTEWVMLKPILVVFLCIYLPWWYLARYELLSFGPWSKIMLVWTGVVAIYFINRLLLWLLTSYILTDQRLVCVHYTSLIKKQVLETPLERILNISYRTTGLFSSLLSFGSIDVQIMGLAEPLELKNIRNPAKVKDILRKVHSAKAAKNPHFSHSNPAELQKPHILQEKKREM